LSFVVILSPAIAQQTATVVQPGTLLRQSLAAQIGNTSISDVTVTGTARRIAGSDDESGKVTLKALSSGATRLDFNFPSGPRSEFKSFASNASTSAPTGAWSGSDGVSHPIAGHNLVGDWGWFPLFTLASVANTQNYALSVVGSETRNGQSVTHVVAVGQFPSLSGNAATLLQHLSRVDIFLDVTTLLTASITYNIHPDSNALQDVPVELHFSDYRATNGFQIPFHIQKFINNSLVLDLQFQSVTLNTGLTVAHVGAQ
jgi:hypothetical protein